jgi:hypothetical protein
VEGEEQLMWKPECPDIPDDIVSIPVANCLGVPWAKIRNLGAVGLCPPTSSAHPKWTLKRSVTVFNDKVGRWETYGLVDYVAFCPGECGRRIRVLAIAGTTWLATCSEECYRQLRIAHPEWFAPNSFTEADVKAAREGALHEWR